MLIADGNITFAVINAIVGEWMEVRSKKIYNFGRRESSPAQVVLTIDAEKPLDCRISFVGEICYIEFNKEKYRLWYMDNTKEVKFELHSEDKKIKLEKYKPKL